MSIDSVDRHVVGSVDAPLGVIAPVIMMYAALYRHRSSVFIPPYHNCIYYLWEVQDLHSFLHLILYMCFPHQFFIKGDTKVFHLLRQGQLHSLILLSWDLFGLPPSCKEYSLCFLRVY